MKRMISKVIISLFVVFFAIVIILIGYFVFISRGTIKGYRDKYGNILENSIAEKIKVEINGVKNGMFLRGKSKDAPVILFISSGPGTPDYFMNEAYPKMNLEDYFVVCNWEYRGSGMVYDPDMDPNTITTEQIIKDTVEVTEYLKKRFQKEKIYIMGFSGGTNIALQTVAKYPDNYYAYIAMAQVVAHGEDNDTLMYDFMKNVFTKRKDKSRIKELNSYVEKQPNGKYICKDRYSYVQLLHEAGGGTIKDKTEFEGIVIPILKSHCYTVKEKFDYVKGMKMYRKTPFSKDCGKMDYRKSIKKLDIPVYFISGNYDYNCPWPIVEEYYNMIEAPKKKFYLIDGAAHSPLWERSDLVVPIIVNEIGIDEVRK